MSGEYVGLFQRLDEWMVLRLSDEGEPLAEFATYVEHEAPGYDWLVLPLMTAQRCYPTALAQYRRYERAMRQAMEEDQREAMA